MTRLGMNRAVRIVCGFWLLCGLLVSRPAAPQPAEAWLAVYDGSAGQADAVQALALDGGGNVYVTGSSEAVETGYDFTTVKYDGAGNELWTARYNGPRPDEGWDFGTDSATGLAVDGAGNVYVSGVSTYSCPGLRGCFHHEFATVKYDAAGNELWVARNVEGLGGLVALDRAGNVHVAGPGGVVKLDPQGNELWAVLRLQGSGAAAGLAVDDAGNVYVAAGQVTAKYDAGGNELWTAVVEAAAVDLAVDGAGNAYITGTSTSLESEYDYLTMKFDAGGNELWAAAYDGPGRPAGPGTVANRNDYARALAVDGAGNVYVTGQSIADPSNFDFATVKYDAGGNELWVARHANVETGARDIALSPGGTIYVGGDRALLAYDPAGNEIGVAETDFRAEVMALDGAGNVYLGGFRLTQATGLDYVTAKYTGVRGLFRRGDANGDGAADVSDAVFILSHLFHAGREPSCLKSADLDDRGALEITDPVFLLNFLFLGGPVPAEPFSGCGLDPTADELSCASFAPCL